MNRLIYRSARGFAAVLAFAALLATAAPVGIHQLHTAVRLPGGAR